ncbi:MAG TPA: antibiotic biosynthesis monooxygenase [Solibacterales bacterium]|nr:antibiotic biosynthesis monooxygenase [Bryobacterales bacterium]
MLVVHVHVHVKPEHTEAFVAATLANARESVKEPGIARFDVVRHAADPTRFVLVEVYRDAAAPAAHKETAHYQTWRDAVAPMMAEPRTSEKYTNLFPEDQGW